MRRSGSTVAAIATSSRTSGTIALAFTDMPSARQIAEASSRRANRHETAAATKSATSMSLWPPPDDVEHDDRVQPDHGDREDGPLGAHPLDEARRRSTIVPRLASAASSWKPRIVLSTLRARPVISTETHVNNGP